MQLKCFFETQPFILLIALLIFHQILCIWNYFCQIDLMLANYVPFLLFLNSCYKNISDAKRNPNNQFKFLRLLAYELCLTIIKILSFNYLMKGTPIPNMRYFITIFTIFIVMVYLASQTKKSFFDKIYNYTIVRTFIVYGIYYSKIKAITPQMFGNTLAEFFKYFALVFANGCYKNGGMVIHDKIYTKKAFSASPQFVTLSAELWFFPLLCLFSWPLIKFSVIQPQFLLYITTSFGGVLSFWLCWKYEKKRLFAESQRQSNAIKPKNKLQQQPIIEQKNQNKISAQKQIKHQILENIEEEEGSCKAKVETSELFKKQNAKIYKLSFNETDGTDDDTARTSLSEGNEIEPKHFPVKLVSNV